VKLGEFTEDVVLARAQEQYRESRAHIEVESGATALVIVDMLDEFVKPGWSPFWVPDATRQAPRIRELVDAFHEADMPVIHLGYEVSLRGLNFPRTEWIVPIADGFAGFEHDLFQKVSFYGPLQPDPQDLVILKHCYSGFHGTELDLVLRGLGIRTLVITGTMSNYCCGATAREAFWHGYGVIFGSDVTSSDDDELHEAELRTLRRGFARIATADEILADVRATAATATATA
jgi:nicotinamidase-related amidase